MASKVMAQRRESTASSTGGGEKRRKPRRQSGQAVAHESKETIVLKSRLQRTDSDKVIRRKSMERNSIRVEFLQGLKGLGDGDGNNSLTRMSLASAVRGSVGRGYNNNSSFNSNNESRGELLATMANLNASHNTSGSSSSSLQQHGPEFTEQQMMDMSNQALLQLQLSDSESECSEAMDEEEEVEEEKDDHL